MTALLIFLGWLGLVAFIASLNHVGQRKHWPPPREGEDDHQH
jgi:hypothetical protein